MDKDLSIELNCVVEQRSVVADYRAILYCPSPSQSSTQFTPNKLDYYCIACQQ